MALQPVPYPSQPQPQPQPQQPVPYPSHPQPQPQPQQPQPQPQPQQPVLYPSQPQPQPQQPVPYPSQPQAHAYYSYSPQPQQAAIINYPQTPQNNVNVVDQAPSMALTVMPQNKGVMTTIPTNGSLQISNAVNGIPFQHPPTPLPPVVNGAWTTGLFDCMDDPTNAFITALFPCVTFGQIADVLDNGHTTCATSGIVYAFAPCLVSGPYRKMLRQRFGLVEAPAKDRIIHSIFEPCALCQEYRELNNRGIDPALGYHGNLNKQKTSSMMVPPGNQIMMT